MKRTPKKNTTRLLFSLCRKKEQPKLPPHPKKTKGQKKKREEKRHGPESPRITFRRKGDPKARLT